jgi:hypothetical protein
MEKQKAKTVDFSRFAEENVSGCHLEGNPADRRIATSDVRFEDFIPPSGVHYVHAFIRPSAPGVTATLFIRSYDSSDTLLDEQSRSVDLRAVGNAIRFLAASFCFRDTSGENDRSGVMKSYYSSAELSGVTATNLNNIVQKRHLVTTGKKYDHHVRTPGVLVRHTAQPIPPIGSVSRVYSLAPTIQSQTTVDGVSGTNFTANAQITPGNAASGTSRWNLGLGTHVLWSKNLLLGDVGERVLAFTAHMQHVGTGGTGRVAIELLFDGVVIKSFGFNTGAVALPITGMSGSITGNATTQVSVRLNNTTALAVDVFNLVVSETRIAQLTTQSPEESVELGTIAYANDNSKFSVGCTIAYDAVQNTEVLSQIVGDSPTIISVDNSPGAYDTMASVSVSPA